VTWFRVFHLANEAREFALAIEDHAPGKIVVELTSEANALVSPLPPDNVQGVTPSRRMGVGHWRPSAAQMGNFS